MLLRRLYKVFPVWPIYELSLPTYYDSHQNVAHSRIYDKAEIEPQ